jgi:hypothetical protein
LLTTSYFLLQARNTWLCTPPPPSRSGCRSMHQPQGVGAPARDDAVTTPTSKALVLAKITQAYARTRRDRIPSLFAGCTLSEGSRQNDLLNEELTTVPAHPEPVATPGAVPPCRLLMSRVRIALYRNSIVWYFTVRLSRCDWSLLKHTYRIDDVFLLRSFFVLCGSGTKIHSKTGLIC